MSVEVVMPQMGESIAEGTVSKWLKKVGEKVAKDEPILEISTDKVDAEVPSPASGVILEIKVNEGETVPVGTVVALIGEENEAPKTEATKQSVAVAAIESEKIKEVPSEPQRSEKSFGAVSEVVMPQMGESIAEGTVSKWLKKVGEKVAKDEPILEISTDKVDAEVPSPASGVILEIRVNEGETVPVGTVVAVIGKEGAQVTAKESKEAEITEFHQVASEQEKANVAVASIKSEQKERVEGNGSQMTVEELRRKKSSPLVRSIAKKHGIDISKIQGTGASGRVTKKDILAYIESGAAFKPQDLMAKAEKAPVEAPKTSLQVETTKVEYTPPAITASVGDRVEPMSVMRKKIAEHMVFSKRTSAHVTTVYEIDMTNVARFRDQHKAEFQARYGTKLTYMPFIFQAVVQGLRKFPIINAQVSGDQIIYKGDINLGMAVALDWGLIVPVIKKADTLSLAGLALAANDLAERARAKKLTPDEVQGGTFTVTNPGVFGGLFGTPIINQPQVAILCVGVIEKRPKVITTPEGDDVIAIRQMAYFALTYDHRIIDGADAEKFLSFIKEYLETTKFSL
ncbi:MAG: 2-oxoglutarate dehydrogenase, E2 component, dihydrolipoamide succinyltransferase [Pyrinomonadaceae bacterium]|nr:2-oxoglutarate dehydrogenase, E2 component, dihydrolipoamide succinyltransferase [Pyrinomonadaceae bacterium]MCX7639588.1 2-oxoglutarate dehydrogenase, E2 component, dihydrolipoamide succinyltransferase [Pyrinomonadaceae bacterium]MDW8303981.1 2-oxoglutarate dehydrogenase, E2 component, dihydrolipoamide succinyltransferase [Acidobacteriota bacterium]